MDKLGFDGVGLNEHHTTPHGLMNSPNMMAAVAAQRTKKLKFLMLGNLVPLHNPLRIAEELAMADTHVARAHSLRLRPRRAARVQRLRRVDGRIARALRGGGRHHPQGLDRAEVFLRGQILVVQGHRDLAAALQQPHPPVWVPFTGSKETIEWAGKHNFSAVIPDHHRGLTQDIVGYYAKQLAAHGNRITPEHMCFFTDAYVAKDRETAIKEYSPFYLYFVHTLWHHGSLEKASSPKGTGYLSSSSDDYIKPENRVGVGRRPRGHAADDDGRHRTQDRHPANWPGVRPRTSPTG